MHLLFSFVSYFAIHIYIHLLKCSNAETNTTMHLALQHHYDYKCIWKFVESEWTPYDNATYMHTRSFMLACRYHYYVIQWDIINVNCQIWISINKLHKWWELDDRQDLWRKPINGTFVIVNGAKWTSLTVSLATVELRKTTLRYR